MNTVNTRDVLKHAGGRNILTALAVIIFFVTIIIVFYAFMYTSVKENIKLRGEKIAVRSAEDFDRYLITSADLVKLEKYMLDEMVSDGASHDELQTYLEEETVRIQNAIDKGYTGLYGYIDGEYHDGVNWVPDESYVPTERPWYVDAFAHEGELTVIQPYVDAQTGEIITTLAMTLIDGRGVVALDISFDMIQTVTDDQEHGNRQPLQIIIDDKGGVVAHSYVDEIGHNYYQEDDTMGARIVKKLKGDEERNYEISYDGTKYMIYAIPISNGWYSISVIDSTDSYRPLNMMLVIILSVLVAAVLILTKVFINSSRRSIKAERLNNQLATTANIYMSVYDIDVINDTLEEIQSTMPTSSTIMKDETLGAQESFNRLFNFLPDTSTKKTIQEFVDFSTLDERLRMTNTITTEYQTFGDLWCRARFLVSERTDDGRVARVLYVVENIDAEKRNKDKLIDISERAMAASEAKSAFLSNMSHEIRTPINAMLGLNEMVLRECDDTEILSYASGINMAGHTLLGIVNDILDFSKIEAGKMEIIPVDYSLASMLNDLANMVHTRADDKGLTINIKVDSHIPDFLHGDEIRVKQVITNILTNAVKYTEKGSVTFAVAFDRIEGSDEDIMLKVSVADTGIGIKKEDMGKLFSEFDRIEEKRNRNIEGTGLGMSITQSLLGLMGSSLNVESEYGKGSVFSFEIVQKVLDWREIGDYENTYKENVLKNSTYKEKFEAPDAEVLVVDDTPLNLTVFKSLLKKTRVHIDTADSGDGAIRAACSKTYDIIFLDHMMPKKDGIETLHELRLRGDNQNAKTPIVCLTANAISGMREKYISAGFDDYLTKPIDSAKLEEMLMQYLPEDKLIMVSEDSKEAEAVEDVIPDYIYAIEGVDVDEAVSHCGSAGLYKEILTAFVNVIDGCVDEAKALYNNGELKDAAIKIHAIKSQARTIGAYELGEFAEMLEMAAKDEDVKKLDDNVDALFDRCMELRDKIAPIKEEDKLDESSLPEMTKEHLSELFEKLNEYVQEYEIDSIEAVAEEFRKYHIPDADAKKVNELCHVIDNLDYDQIPEIIASPDGSS